MSYSEPRADSIHTYRPEVEGGETDPSTTSTKTDLDKIALANTTPEFQLPPPMAQTVGAVIEPDRVSVGLRLLVDGLVPFVESRLQRIYGDRWEKVTKESFRDRRQHADGIDWDAHALLTVMWDQWNSVFRHELGHSERSFVSELRDVRNRWAHQQKLDFHDTFRVLDSIRRLLAAVDAPTLPAVERLQQEVLEAHVGEQVNAELQHAAFDRRKFWTIGLYIACCAVIITQFIASPLNGLSGTALTGLVLFVVTVLCYLIYQQFTLEPALLYGPHECPRCRKIIYRKKCPYCG